MSRVVVAALSVLCGCAGWHAIEMPVDTALAPRQQVQLWRGSKAEMLHAVRVTQDSVFGVPFHQPPSCDRCRVAFPRASVDSIRLGNQETPGIVFASIPFVILIYLLIELRGDILN